MKTPTPDVDVFVEALRGDLPSAEDEARVRARLVTATLVATSAALTSANAGASATGAAATSAAPGGVALVNGAGGGALSGSLSAAAGGAAGSIGAAAPAAVKAGLVAKLLVLPLSAKVGVVAGVALAATSVPLVLEQTRGEHRDTSSVSTDARPSPSAARRAAAQASEAGADGVVGVPPVSERPLAPAALEAGTPAGRSPAEPQAAPAPTSSGAAAARAPVDARRERGADARGRAVTPRRSGAADAVSSGTLSSNTTRPTATREARSAPAAAAAAGTSPLGEEARLMEHAMLALGQGDAELARRLLDEHARRFPHGLLAPERERAAQRAHRLVAGVHDDSTF